MADVEIILRSEKQEPLTSDEIDANFANLAARVNTLSPGSSPGEANTGQNLLSDDPDGTAGGHKNVYRDKSGVNLRFKALKAGTNITLSSTDNDVTINSTAVEGSGEANTASNTKPDGVGIFGLSKNKVGIDLPFKVLKAGANVTLSSTDNDNEITIATAGSVGQANTTSNLETDDNVNHTRKGLAAPKNILDLPFKVIKAGTNISLSADSTSVTISAANPVGEANTASNKAADTTDGAGSTKGLYSNKSNGDLQFKSLKAGNNIALSTTGSSTEVTISAMGEANRLSPVDPTETDTKKSLVATPSYSGVDLKVKNLQAGTNISLTSDNDKVTISATGDAAGEANTTSNMITPDTANGPNATKGLAITKTPGDPDLKFKNITAGANVNLTSDPNQVTISVPTIGEVNTASNTITPNTGTVKGLYKQKTSSNLEFKSLAAGSNIAFDETADTVTINAVGGVAGEVNTLASVGTGIPLDVAKSGTTLRIKSLKAGTGVSIEATIDEVTISSSGGGLIIGDTTPINTNDIPGSVFINNFNGEVYVFTASV